MAASRSTRRQKQAAATRQDILVAARRLFATRGYVATSMTAIATEAETAVQTIYDSIGPKRAILLAIVELSEEKAGVNEFRQRIAQATDPREVVALFVALTRQFMEDGGDVFIAMMSAAPTEPDVAAAWQRANQGHRYGAGVVAGLLERFGALKPGVSVERAGDVIGVMSWGTTWLQFTQNHGWSLDACEAWLIETLDTLLLREPSEPGPPS